MRITLLRHVYVNQTIHFLVRRFEQIREGSFAKFTLECFPEESLNWLYLPHLHLHVQPLFKTKVVNEADRTGTFARNYVRIFKTAIITPTESAIALKRASWLNFSWRFLALIRFIAFVSLRVFRGDFLSIFVNIGFHKGHLYCFFEILSVHFFSV